MALRICAPAKINLHLEVLGRREDGYHELSTVFHAVDLHDTLRAEAGDGPGALELEVTTAPELAAAGAGMPVTAGPDNLVLRAAEAFRQAIEDPRAVRLGLTKRIPAGGGLGGGSSDAAAALLLMRALLRPEYPDARLAEIAAGLGADVPFFLRCGTQLGLGIGTELRPLTEPQPLQILLLLPGIGVSTPAVYKNLAPQWIVDPPSPSIRPGEDGFLVGLSKRRLRNDLAASALDLHPQLDAFRRRVEGLVSVQPTLSGSGSTFFALFEDLQRAEAAAATLREEGVPCLLSRSATATVSERRPISD